MPIESVLVVAGVVGMFGFFMALLAWAEINWRRKLWEDKAKASTSSPVTLVETKPTQSLTSAEEPACSAKAA